MIAGTNADDPRLARLRGRIALRRGDRDAAVRHFRQALSDEPYDRVSNSELGKASPPGCPRRGPDLPGPGAPLDEVYNLVTRIGKPNQELQDPDLNRLGRACEAAGLIDEARVVHAGDRPERHGSRATAGPAPTPPVAPPAPGRVGGTHRRNVPSFGGFHPPSPARLGKESNPPARAPNTQQPVRLRTSHLGSTHGRSIVMISREGDPSPRGAPGRGRGRGGAGFVMPSTLREELASLRIERIEPVYSGERRPERRRAWNAAAAASSASCPGSSG